MYSWEKHSILAIFMLSRPEASTNTYHYVTSPLHCINVLTIIRYHQAERGDQLKLATCLRDLDLADYTIYITYSDVEQKLILSSQQIQVTQRRSMWTQ